MKNFRARVGLAALFALLISAMNAAQTKSTLTFGSLYRIHAGFLELKAGEKQVLLVKVDNATIYWDGKADKAAAKKDLSVGDEIIAEIREKDGALVAKKVRFLHR